MGCRGLRPLAWPPVPTWASAWAQAALRWVWQGSAGGRPTATSWYVPITVALPPRRSWYSRRLPMGPPRPPQPYPTFRPCAASPSTKLCSAQTAPSSARPSSLGRNHPEGGFGLTHQRLTPVSTGLTLASRSLLRLQGVRGGAALHCASNCARGRKQILRHLLRRPRPCHRYLAACNTLMPLQHPAASAPQPVLVVCVCAHHLCLRERVFPLRPTPSASSKRVRVECRCPRLYVCQALYCCPRSLPRSSPLSSSSCTQVVRQS